MKKYYRFQGLKELLLLYLLHLSTYSFNYLRRSASGNLEILSTIFQYWSRCWTVWNLFFIAC